MKLLLYDRAMTLFRTLSFLLAMAITSHATMAAELIMVEQRGCEWCEVWDEEIGQTYHQTAEGKIAPLRRINIHDDLPEDLSFIRGLVYTPTFVLVHDGSEVGRILGYPGEDFFWGLLEQLFEKLPKDELIKAKAGSLRRDTSHGMNRSALRG